MSFDLVEPGQPGVSDYVDIGPIDIYFISSDTQGVYDPAEQVDGVVFEDQPGGLEYGLHFESDTDVPEPSTLSLFFAGLGLLAVRNWRKRRAQV